MHITSLQITQLRNICSTQIDCAPQFNLFFGDNAAGKTSVLEAIYYLGAGKSFRTHQHNHVIQQSEDQLMLFARLHSDDVLLQIGLQRSRDGYLQIRFNEETMHSIAEISYALPIQFIGSDSHRILSDGPKCRRQFLDWGLFHTNPLFYSQWKTYQKILIQRNAALKARAPRNELLIWNEQFSKAGEALNLLRKAYLDDFLPVFNKIAPVLLENTPLSVDYFPGWDRNITLDACLNQNVSRETMIGHSLYGPHRADLMLTVNDLPVQDGLSQGQQKLVSYALRLAQGVHLHSCTSKTPIYLIDDLPSELDPQKRVLVTEILMGLCAQVFITGIESHDLQDIYDRNHENKMFHVKHGVVTPC